MIISRSGHARVPSQQRTETFTGLVFADPVLPGADGVTVNNVFFAPGARTYWHSHEGGQLLIVVSGVGLVCQDRGLAQVLYAGDVAWSEPGELHWHGATPENSVFHCAMSLGDTRWELQVDDEEYFVGTDT